VDVLWAEVNSSLVLLQGVASPVIVGYLSLVIARGEAPKQSRWKIDLPFLRLPAQEGIVRWCSRDIPYVGGVGCGRIDDFDYVPACT
jgi:hypothetical protein